MTGLVASDLDRTLIYSRDAMGENQFRDASPVCVEIYRRGGEWKVRAVGQGYAAGLAGSGRARRGLGRSGGAGAAGCVLYASGQYQARSDL